MSLFLFSYALPKPPVYRETLCKSLVKPHDVLFMPYKHLHEIPAVPYHPLSSFLLALQLNEMTSPDKDRLQM
jgi:hypothetical protein